MKTFRLLAPLAILVLLFASCTKETRFIRHKSSLEIRTAPWGVEFDALPPHLDNYPHQLRHITAARVDSLINFGRDLGIKWVRLSVNWSHIVDTAGVYNWDMIDRVVNGLYDNKIEVMFCITGGHIKYTGGHAPNTPESVEHWKEFARKVVARYKDKITYWELWNEPNYISFWRPKPNPVEYVNLMREFHAIVWELDPASVIVGGSLARLDLPYADSILNLGIHRYMDVMSYHPYGEFPEQSVTNIEVSVKPPVWFIEPDHSVIELKQHVYAADPTMRVWQAECGYPSQDNSSGWTGNGPWSPGIQAKWLLRRFIMDLTTASDVINYFCFVEYYSGKLLNSKGLLTIKDLTPKPSYHAYQNLISTLNGKLSAAESDRFDMDIEAYGSFHNIQKKNVKFVEISNESNQNFLAYWVFWRMQDKVEEARISIDIRQPIDQPVLIDLLSGAVRPVEFGMNGANQRLKDLPLADFPYIITEGENISYQ